ncbi:MAG TPA: hypothetical protein VH274_07815 [Mycobacteriales bacterium]|nr:hypothetical protein [Mycobacteriales bacterium]
MNDVQRPTVDELDRLSTEELRQRAFDRAEKHHDIGFFWDLIKHLPPSEDIASEDASSGNITGGLADAVELVRELMGRDLGDAEPLVRARFIDYIRK